MTSGIITATDDIEIMCTRVTKAALWVCVVASTSILRQFVSEVGTVGRRDVPDIVSEMNRTMERAIEKLLTPSPASAAIKGNQASVRDLAEDGRRQRDVRAPRWTSTISSYPKANSVP